MFKSAEGKPSRKIHVSLAVAILMVAIWAVRLEGRVDADGKDILRQQEEAKALREQVARQIRVEQRIDNRLSRIEGALDVKAPDGE